MASVASIVRMEASPGEGDGGALETVLPDLDARLDEALRETFPASDPIAVSTAP
jgi:hypothetical protein